MDEEVPVDVRRSAPEVARRCLALSAVISISYGDDRDTVSQWLKRESLWSDLSPRERAFFANRTPERKEIIAFSWHTERLVPLLWATQKIASMPPLASQCDTDSMKSAIVWPPATTRSFIDKAVLRSDGEIDQEYERIYEAHWRVRDAELKGLPIPAGLDAGAIFERHWSFNWLIGYFGQPWDEISTDT
ncbi:DUF4272 domain-containing protein [Oleiharenicola lentus]|uniref:DUF4272 domain-containing protein n=1 Tax=Oleiharenicola lentus TaxID=2508720 RepID=UPI003F66709A